MADPIVADNSAFGGPNAAQAANANAVTGGAPSTTDFMTQLQGQLLNQSGMISSSNTKLEDQINSAISSRQAAGTATDKGINASYAGQEQTAQQAGNAKMTAATEAQRGFAQNTAALQQLTDATNKQVNDLETQKQVALATADSATADKLSDLQVQAITFQQQAQQQTFSNLLGMANFGVNAQQAQTQQRSQDFQEQSAISNIATKYGLTVGPGETIQSIATKAAPFASKEEQQQIALATSQIQANQASTAKALADIQADKPLDAATLAGLGASWNNGGAAVIQSSVKSLSQLGQVIKEAGNQTLQTQQSTLDQNKAAGQSKADAVNSVVTNTKLSPDQQTQLLSHIDSVYGADSAQKSSSFNPFDAITNFGLKLMKEPPLQK